MRGRMNGSRNPGGWMDQWDLGPYQVLAVAAVGMLLIAGSAYAVIGAVHGGEGLIGALVRLYPDWPSCARDSALPGGMVLACPVLDTMFGAFLLSSSVRYWRFMLSDE